MTLTLNKSSIIEEANLYSQMLRNKYLTQAVQNQNNRLGPDHPTTQKNLNMMAKNSRQPIQENLAVKGAAGVGVLYGVKKGAQALNKAIDDGKDLGGPLSSVANHTKAINGALDNMQ